MIPKKTPEVVVITGASAGVGRATAVPFARRGAHIGLLARGRAGLEGARRDVERLGGKALVLPTDVADRRSGRSGGGGGREPFGPIDVWVNDAMCSVFSPVKEMTPAEYRRVTEVTYLGSVYGTLAALEADAAARPRRSSSRSARRWRTAASRCSRPTAPPSTPSRASATRCTAS